MTAQYVIIAGQPPADAETRMRRVPSLIHRHKGLAIWSDTTPISIGDRGWLLGHLFRRSRESTRIETLAESEVRIIEDSDGQHLIDAYWGGYVAVMRGVNGIVRVIRDPSGMMPCFFGRTDDAVIISDDAKSIVDFIMPARPVDFGELARFIASPDWAGRETCLAGVSEMIGGECLIWNHDRCDFQALWSPWKFAGRKNPHDDLGSELGEVLADTIGAWAECFPKFVVGISGGLDSSIVATLSATGSTDPRYFTMVGADPDGDETRYAAIVTDSLGVPLNRFPYDAGVINVEEAPIRHQPRPSAAYFAQSIKAAHRALIAEASTDALFVGNGGDGVFFSTRSASPLTDRCLAQGLGRGALETLRDIAILTDASWAEIVRQAIRRYRLRANATQPKCDFTGLRREMIEAIGTPRPRHPWMIAAATAYPGKIAHVGNVMRAQKNISFYSHGDGPPQIAPLLSQPVVELCLSIPTWRWVAAGHDRAVARQAVQHILPKAIADRTSKGGPDGFMHALSRRRGHEIREFLRNGVLVREGVIDPEFLDGPHEIGWRGKPAARRLLAFGVAESWTRYWLASADDRS